VPPVVNGKLRSTRRQGLPKACAHRHERASARPGRPRSWHADQPDPRLATDQSQATGPGPDRLLDACRCASLISARRHGGQGPADIAVRRGAGPGIMGRVSSPRDDAGLTQGRGKWPLPVGDGKVTQIQVDYAFTLVLDSWISIRIETSFSYGAAGAERQFEPSDAPGLAPLLDLHQATVTSAEIAKDGSLTMASADGGELLVPPDERYEAFTVTATSPPARRAFSFTTLPGGGLSRW
jgi:Family of unknown function (DUF6188)